MRVIYFSATGNLIKDFKIAALVPWVGMVVVINKKQYRIVEMLFNTDNNSITCVVFNN